MSLTKCECKQIDQAIATKQSSPYVQGYEAAVRELKMLQAGGLSFEEAIQRMSQPAEAKA